MLIDGFLYSFTVFFVVIVLVAMFYVMIACVDEKRLRKFGALLSIPLNIVFLIGGLWLILSYIGWGPLAVGGLVGLIFFRLWVGQVAVGEILDELLQELSQSQPSPRPKNRIVPEQAYKILGLHHHASVEEVKAAHKKLIIHLHPDRGGSTFLTTLINDARDCLLKK